MSMMPFVIPLPAPVAVVGAVLVVLVVRPLHALISITLLITKRIAVPKYSTLVRMDHQPRGSFTARMASPNSNAHLTTRRISLQWPRIQAEIRVKVPLLCHLISGHLLSFIMLY